MFTQPIQAGETRTTGSRRTCSSVARAFASEWTKGGPSRSSARPRCRAFPFSGETSDAAMICPSFSALLTQSVQAKGTASLFFSNSLCRWCFKALKLENFRHFAPIFAQAVAQIMRLARIHISSYIFDPSSH